MDGERCFFNDVALGEDPGLPGSLVPSSLLCEAETRRRRRGRWRGRARRLGEDDGEATTTMETGTGENGQPPEIDAAEYEEKHRKYEALYSRRLRAKYFSKKTLDGGDLYDQETVIENEVIKSSRWPCTRSFADPIKYMEDQNQSSSEAETTTTINKKQAPKKSC